jgi:DNA topoisomerase VI subunit B
MYSVDYEVALEIIGQRLQPYIRAIEQEKNKEKPSDLLIHYCKTRIKAIDDLQDDLTPDDTEIIKQILDKDSPIFKN